MTLKEHFRTNFNIRLLEGEIGADINELLKGKVVKDFLAETCWFKNNQIVIKADPFLFVHKDRLFLFYEEKLRKDPGYIKMTCTKDLINWTDPILILKEPFHLSFPFVFEHDGNVYLMPECGESKEIRMYCFDDDDLRHCKLCHVPIKGEFVDSSIIENEGCFFLFTSDRKFNQRLFISHELLGKYVEHPNSPICNNRRYGRNAGSVFRYRGDMYRPSQDCSRLYGGNVSLHKITKLDSQCLEEELYLDNILDIKNPFYKYGGHQFNMIVFRNKMIVATDALDLNFNFYQIVNKINKKVFSF